MRPTTERCYIENHDHLNRKEYTKPCESLATVKISVLERNTRSLISSAVIWFEIVWNANAMKTVVKLVDDGR